ncbi:MAG: hypothetical protein DRQ88_03800 [Epsilonproteobacteria bacterium]|nr:MAG: hypothetical protein DRQ89_04105 [Campylobacterota bacterium]RLA67162.1 MAG: hypothetical protein DRQ88_03800 [Campylobacterota bacterium]
MVQDIPMLFIAGFVAFFMGGFVFTYWAIVYFENKAQDEDKDYDKILHLPDRPPGKASNLSEEEYAEDKKIA